MDIAPQLAKHFKEVFFGGNWTDVNLKDSLKDVSWQHATAKLCSFNTIAALVYHIDYYVVAILSVLKGEPLTASDKYSFDHPPVQSEEEWNSLLEKLWSDAEKFAELVEELPERKLLETFSEEKYGNYYRNFQGVIEHTHYHLGQIVLIKKLLLNSEAINKN
jgi:uncharacterized damage-inducible protein DinB